MTIFKQITQTIFALLFLLLLSKNSKAQNISKNMSLDFSLGTTYDDNILRNSEKYLTRFLNNEDQGRFLIESNEGLFIRGSVRASYNLRLLKNRRSLLFGSFLTNSYLNNRVKNWSQYNIRFQQSLANRTSFRVSFSYIPNFYVRHFRDADLVALNGFNSQAFAPFEFAKKDYGFWVRKKFAKNTQIRLSATKSHLLHNEHYTEYDAENLALGLRVTQPITKNLRLGVGYQNTNSEAKAFDEVGETKATSDEGDASYKEHRINIGLKIKLPKFFKLKNDIDINGRFVKRNFTSTKPISINPLHVNRIDTNTALTLNYNLRINRDTRLRLFYTRNIRDSHNSGGTAFDEMISREKDFQQTQIGFRLAYSIF